MSHRIAVVKDSRLSPWQAPDKRIISWASSRSNSGNRGTGALRVSCLLTLTRGTEGIVQLHNLTLYSRSESLYYRGTIGDVDG
jgi:hypothetical protein